MTQETYREKEKDRATAIKLLCFSISSIKFSVSKGCAGPNTIFNTFVNIIFTEGLDDKELSLLIIYYKVRAIELFPKQSHWHNLNLDKSHLEYSVWLRSLVLIQDPDMMPVVIQPVQHFAHMTQVGQLVVDILQLKSKETHICQSPVNWADLSKVLQIQNHSGICRNQGAMSSVCEAGRAEVTCGSPGEIGGG
nr:hypothetical protein Iba_chr14aCG22700 [Ipomoea batatas]